VNELLIRLPYPDHRYTDYFRLRSLNELKDQLGLSIRFVINGNERFALKNREVTLNEGEYLLTIETTPEIALKVNSGTQVVMLSITIPFWWISGVSSDFKDEEVPQQYQVDFDFVVGKFSVHETHLGGLLVEVGKDVLSMSLRDESTVRQFLIRFVEMVIVDNDETEEKMTAMGLIKKSTRQEVYRRLCASRMYIDESFLDRINIEDMAREACLSMYHFIRMFRRLFGVTPYQYLINKRLEHAMHLLHGGESVTRTAEIAGFTDIQSFSKAFKKHFGVNPSQSRS
jgi:AraC family transcriptional regulator